MKGEWDARALRMQLALFCSCRFASGCMLRFCGCVAAFLAAWLLFSRSLHAFLLSVQVLLRFHLLKLLHLLRWMHDGAPDVAICFCRLRLRLATVYKLLFVPNRGGRQLLLLMLVELLSW